MPEVLGDAALYFDPVNVTTIKKALKVILDSPETRKRLAEKAFNNAMQFSWEKCATQTISFIKSISGSNAEQ
jgi:glycosyltransferase involved in cell wall biosynthesis